MLRILVADDHEVVRKGLVKVLAESLQPIEIHEASNGQEAVSKVRKGEYDLVVLDLKMPGKSGLDALKEIKQHQPKLPAIILSMHPEEQFAIRAMRAGASGYLTKECAGDELVLAIRKALRGEKYISGSLAQILADGLDSDQEKPPHEILSDREYQVMLMIASGKPVERDRQGVVPERKDHQQLSDEHPAEDEDEEQLRNNPLRHPEQTRGLIRALRRPFPP